MGHLQLEWVRSGLQLRACGRLSVEGILKQCSPPPPSQVSMKCRRRCIHFMHGSIWPVTIPPPPPPAIKNNFPLILQSTCLFSCSLHNGCSLWASSPIWASKASPTTTRERAAKPRGELAHRLWWLQTSRLSIFKEKCRSLWESGWRGITYQKSVFKGIF